MIDVFVSVPYNHHRQDMIDFRLAMLDEYMVKLINEGITPYSTIQSMHELTIRHNISKDYDFWRDHCAKMIHASEEFHVLMLPGWRVSKGVTDEIELAHHNSVPVSYIDDYYHR